MPLDEGADVDLQFLILEVKKQAKASLSAIDKPTAKKLQKIRDREDYVDNLKNSLENKSYFNIHHLVQEERQVNYYKALITIASNLERCADFFENIAGQLDYVKDATCFKEFELRRFYRVIFKTLDIIYPALADHNLGLARKVCDSEDQLDELYKEGFNDIRANLRKRRHVDDMLTLLFIIRYLERVGDSFLNIGEAILDIHVGEKMTVDQFQNLQKGLKAQDIDISSERVEFKPIMNTRSGCRVAGIVDRTEDGEVNKVFYKEGPKDKIDSEVRGLDLWQNEYPGWVPSVLWHDSRENHSTLLLEYIDGMDLLEVVIKHRGQSEHALTLLTNSLVHVWEGSKRVEPVGLDYIGEIVSRREDIQTIHGHLFRTEEGIDELLRQARQLENTLRAPFTTLVHGDFNLDNIIFDPEGDRVYFVDVHRSSYGDYVQDVSVFLVSNFRIPIFSRDIRTRLNAANVHMYECARNYAKDNGDRMFEARLAFGLFRSLITSTRFLFDKQFSSDMFRRGTSLLKELLEHKDNLEQFQVSREYFLYE